MYRCNMFQTISLRYIIFLLVLTGIKCNSTPSVLIIGAGPSGIAAATKLLENNITNITILEAEERIGGRIYSVQFADLMVDLGAQWCHGEENNIVYELVKDLDLLEPGTVWLNYYHSSQQDLDLPFIDELSKIFISIKNEEILEDDLSQGEFITRRYNETVLDKYGDEPEKVKFAWEYLDFVMKAMLSGYSAFSWFDVSAKYDYTECEGNHFLSWKGHGYKTILDVLMKKYPNPEEQLPIDDKILLNKKVTKILWDQQKPTIECLDGPVYSADYVIFTASLGVLKDRYKSLFIPSLPAEKVNVIEQLGFGAVIKVFLHFQKKWWPENNFTDFSFIWAEEDRQSFNKNGELWITDMVGLYESKETSNVLVAWFCGTFVPEIELISDDALLNGIMIASNTFLGHQFGNIPEPDSFMRHSWYANPHFKGTYSYQTVDSRRGGVSPEVILSHPLTTSNGKQSLLFAGEATHPIYYSTVHGAIEAGYREAQRIIAINTK